MTLGTFEPQGFEFTEAGASAILEELADQIDVFVAEQVAAELKECIEEGEGNLLEFRENLVVFDMLHDGESYTRKALLLAMVDEACIWQDPEPLQQTLQTLKEAVRRIEQALAPRK